MEKLTFKELKDYFNQHKDDLPQTVGNDFMLVWDVRESARINIQEIERETIKYNGDPRKSLVAKAAKARLQNLYEMCVDTTTHNKPKFEYNPFSNHKN